MSTVKVSTKNSVYDIVASGGLFSKIGEDLKVCFPSCKMLVISDQNVHNIYGAKLSKQLHEHGISFETLVFPAGEKTKSSENLSKIYTTCARMNINRGDLIVAFGGGVIGDLAGFAASSFLRGVPFVQIPTTLLAQIDSSVGGKVAINIPEGKNLVGSFYQPKKVYIDPDLLSTLSDDVFADGIAEMIKYGLICDADLFEKLEKYNTREKITPHLIEYIIRCCEIKADVVNKDERDLGIRMILNYGHTLGHAIEAYKNYTGITHGQAISIGMVAVSRGSEQQGITPAGTTNRIIDALTSFGLPTTIEDVTVSMLLGGIAKDKKNIGSKLNLIVLRSIGESDIIKIAVEEALEYICI